MLFEPLPPLLSGRPHPDCCAVVIVPARNEEESLAATLDALAAQVDEAGFQLPCTSYEILLLLNNCTDRSACVVQEWKRRHPECALQVVEHTFPSEYAHVGTARRLLMDTAWHRLSGCSSPHSGILSTDSDTIVARDWITKNLRALRHGADAVGGQIQLKEGDLAILPEAVRKAYLCDRRYQQLVAELEDLLDPQPGDSSPRHLEHFGASLACTPDAYKRAGGMPAVKPLEDVAFVDALRRTDARLRHEPGVVVYTSARLDGRAEIGLSHQLRLWQELSVSGRRQEVDSAAWLTHRFRSLYRLRRVYAQKNPRLNSYSAEWQMRLSEAHSRRDSPAQFLCDIDCDRFIEERFRGERMGEISQVNRNIARTVAQIRSKDASFGTSSKLSLSSAVGMTP